MTLLDVICRMPSGSIVTVVDCKGEILIDCDTCDRISAFDDVDKEIHQLLRNSQVYKIEVGKVLTDLILSVTVVDKKRG